jgi:hypothetical protein
MTTLLGLPLLGQATTLNQIGIFANWPTLWHAIPGLSDPAGDIGSSGLAVPAKLDFVGDSADPGGYFANEGGYLFLRMRVDGGVVVGTGTDTGRTYQSAMTVLIDVVGATIDTATGLLIPTETVANRRPT